MSDLKAKIIEAHGGMSRWRQFRELRVHLRQGGALWGLKGKATELADTWVTVSLREQRSSHEPVGKAGRHSLFTPPGRVALYSDSGSLEEEMLNPRKSFAGHTQATPWNDLQLVYFAGNAMWTYLNMPFLLNWDGVETEEAGSWSESGEKWQRLRVKLPPSITSHNSVQTLYAGSDGLIRRHDYDVEITGGSRGAHYLSDYTQVQGLQFPSKRRVYERLPDETAAVAGGLVISIDLDSYTLR